MLLMCQECGALWKSTEVSQIDVKHCGIMPMAPVLNDKIECVESFDDEARRFFETQKRS